MNNIPRQELRRITAKYGKAICSDARRCKGLLNDLCGAYRREINVLVNAIDEHIPLDLLAGANSVPHEVLMVRLEKQLADQTAMNAEAARWAVESWALALGIVTDSEIKQRISAQSNRSSVALSPKLSESQKESTNVPILETHKSAPKSPSLSLPPPIKNIPPVYTPVNNSPVQTGSVQPQSSSNQPVISKKRFSLFRGCLILAVLMAAAFIVLLFGVPYAIEVMRETQRERNNQSPRLPSR